MKRKKRDGRLYALRCISGILHLLSGKPKPGSGIRRVLIIRYDGLGDFILFLDIAKEFRKLYPNAEIVLSCSPEAREIAARTGYFDTCLSFGKDSFSLRSILRTYRKARTLDCDLLIHPTISRDFYSEILVSFVKAPRKVTVHNDHSYPEALYKWAMSNYTDVLKVDHDAMVLKQNAEMLRQLGATDFQCALPVIPASEADFHLCLPEQYYVLFIGGSKWDKLWPIERFAAIMQFLSEQTKYPCVVCGVQADLSQEQYLRKQGLTYYSYVGKTTIPELMSIIAGAAFVIGNDTSAIHMAAAQRTPSFCIRSAVSKHRFYPYRTEKANEPERYLPQAVGVDPDCAGCAWNGIFLECNDFGSKHAKMRCITDVSLEVCQAALEVFLAERGFLRR